MMGWRRVKFAEVLALEKNSIEIDKSKHYKLVTISNKGEIKLRQVVKGVQIAADKAFLAKSGRFIYSRLSVHNGAFGIIPDELDGALVTSEMPIFECKKNILPNFLIYSLQLPAFKYQLQQLTKGIGRTRVKEAAFLNLYIDLPTLNEQEDIIKKIEYCNELLTQVTTLQNDQLRILKRLKQAFLSDAMYGQITKRELSDGISIELLKTIKAEKQKSKHKPLAVIKKEEIQISIPHEWIWCRFGDIVNMSRGRFSIRPRNSPGYFGGNYPFIQIGSLDESGKEINTAPQSLNEKGFNVSKEFPKGTIVIAIVGGTIGNLGVLGKPMCFTDSMIGILPSDLYNQQFILNYLRLVQPAIRRAAYQRAGQPNIKIPTLSQLLFPLPPLAEQERIVEKLDELMRYCDDLEHSIADSQAHTDMLLQQVLREALQPQGTKALA